MHETYVENRVGAVVFFAYIAAALLFTALISRDLINLYVQRNEGSQNHPKSTTRVVFNRTRTTLLTLLASVSFAVLSYHMLSFLIQSYTVWSRQRLISTPERLYGFQGFLGPPSDRTALHVWEWSKQSTLFQDFAQVIVDDPRRYWWTQLALLYSLGWNMCMAIEGVRLQVPHLWAYYVLAQILPISFTQNLFCVAISLVERPSRKANLVAAPSRNQLTVVIAYLLCLSIVPHIGSKSTLLLFIFAIRALLVMPLWIMRPIGGSQSPPVRETTEHQLYWQYRYAMSVLSVVGLLLQVRQTLFSIPVADIMNALSDNFAVAALGYDFIIAISSLGIVLGT